MWGVLWPKPAAPSTISRKRSPRQATTKTKTGASARQLVSTLRPSGSARQHASAFQASLSAKSSCGLILTRPKNRSQGKSSHELADGARDDFAEKWRRSRNVLTSEGVSLSVLTRRHRRRA